MKLVPVWARFGLSDRSENSESFEKTQPVVEGTPSPRSGQNETTEVIEEVVTTDERKSRWRWNDEKIESLIFCLYDYKIKKDYEGKDMEADLVRLYEDVRQMMASMYPPEKFGPEEISKISEGLDDHEKFKRERFIAEEKRLIKVGYGRVKGRVKTVRQNFKKAVTEGTRSGSGKLLIRNWDRLVMIWGGCPSVTKIGGAVSSIAAENSGYVSDDESETEEASATDVEPQENREETEQEIPCSKKRNECSSASTSSTDDQTPKRTKLTDNKRAKLEKPLSSQQRDQIMVQVAKDELEIKKRNTVILEQSAKGMEKMVETMAQSINGLGQQLGNGLLNLAQAMSNNPGYQVAQQCQYPPYSFPQPTQQQQYVSTPYTTLLNSVNVRHAEEDQNNLIPK
eukprot:gene2803-3243_t